MLIEPWQVCSRALQRVGARAVRHERPISANQGVVKAIRVFWLPPSDGALYSSGKNLLADLKAWRVDDPQGALASQGRSSYMAAMAEACSRGTRSKLERRSSA